MTLHERAVKGGLALKEKRGLEHFHKIGGMGGRPKRKPATQPTRETKVTIAKSIPEMLKQVRELYPELRS